MVSVVNVCGLAEQSDWMRAQSTICVCPVLFNPSILTEWLYLCLSLWSELPCHASGEEIAIQDTEDRTIWMGGFG